MTIDVKGPVAVADVKVVMVFGKSPARLKDVIPDAAAAMRFGVVLKKEGDDLKTTGAAWKRVGVAGLI